MASRMVERATAAAALARIGGGARNGGVAQPIGDFLNRPLAEVQKNSFFGWFHLGETRREPLANDGQKIDFHPTGERFHDLAMVTATGDADTLIQRIELVLERSFIASPRDGVFASDIAKSFISASLPQSDAEELSTLAREIVQRTRSSQLVIVGPGYELPKVPDRPSAAFETYAGVRRSYLKKLAGCRFGIENRRSSDGDQLSIYFNVR
jgi:hypothetical protein